MWIQESLYGIDSEIAKTKQKISYYQTYKIPYLKSDYAIKFLKHQNWLPQDDNELIIKLQKADETFNQAEDTWNITWNATETKTNDIVINTRSDFWLYKIKKWV